LRYFEKKLTTDKSQKPKAKSQKPKAKSQKPKAKKQPRLPARLISRAASIR
jgi:hypothetical protein